ncbi:MAG TPA: DUF2905 domain-containing protein [Pyrinomonadaceae bacterium]|jgi:uncharacterized membrane protein
MSGRSSGLFVVVVGFVIVGLGLLMWAGALSWFGRLPGDLRFGGERTRVFIPITSMLIVSLLLSLIMWVVRRFF